MFKIIIMCGGEYSHFKQHKALSVINGETLLDRTIRLLKENGIEDIYISATDPVFNKYPNVLHHTNTYKYKDGKQHGYWVDAYYPTNEPTIYLHGDVYYTSSAIRKILNLNPSVNTFIGNQYALNEAKTKVGEPFGWIIVDTDKFHKAIEETKRLQDEGKCNRMPVSWELYQVLNGNDVNGFDISTDTYLAIYDETIDIDSPEQIEILEKKVSENNAI